MKLKIDNLQTKSAIPFLISRIELSKANTLKIGETTLDFKFGTEERKYNTYFGAIGKVRYCLKCTMKRFSNITKKIEIGVINKPTKSIKKSYEKTITTPIEMSFAIESTNYEINDVVRGLMKMKYKTDYQIDLFDVIELHLQKKEIISVEKGTKETIKTIHSIDIVKGVPESDELVQFNLILPTHNLQPSFQIPEGFQLQYLLTIYIKNKNEILQTLEIPITIVKDVQSTELIQKRTKSMLAFLDEMDKFDVIEPQDFNDIELIKLSNNSYENVEEKDDEETASNAQKKLESDAQIIRKIEFDWE